MTPKDLAAAALLRQTTGHEKQAEIFSKAIGLGKGLFSGGARAAKGTAKAAPAAVPRAVGGWAPGANRMALGTKLLTAGNKPAQFLGKHLTSWGSKARGNYNKAFQSGAGAMNTWNAATGAQRAGMVGKGALKGTGKFIGKTWLPTAAFYTGQSAGTAAGVSQGYADGAGEALGYLQANPMQALGLAITRPEYAQKMIGSMGMPEEMANAFQQRMQASNAYHRGQGDPNLSANEYAVGGLTGAANRAEQQVQSQIPTVLKPLLWTNKIPLIGGSFIGSSEDVIRNKAGLPPA